MHKSLKKDYPGLFKEFSNKNYFILSLVYGFNNEARLPLKKKATGGFFRADTLSDSDFALLQCIAIHEENEEILNNPYEVFTIVEEYAHGGLELMVKDFKGIQFGSLEKWFEKEVMKLYKAIGDKN